MTSIQKLAGHRFMQADYSIGRFAATVPAETTLEDVTHPEYFGNHLNSLRVGATINVLSDDHKLDCDLRVLSVTKTSAKVRVLRVYDEQAAPKVKDAEISAPVISHGGPVHKWRFIHNGEVIQHGFESKDAAERAAAKYIELLKGE
ncbi:hypothetical protein U8C32_02525 [Sinorhizobium medicae]|uniref:hypothetical protein n=1 Tax=Sinorhizobium TaxID=28105 RepID=UPI0002F95B01|nr:MULTISPECIES: hypothetical protein [Sinorhizobium]RVN58498.1 hypothetical protein CN108_05535 [Sinorhizobium meliloti]WQO92518.1 hypothetical protein U8C32_02525 [Sinorhizobium medicae]